MLIIADNKLPCEVKENLSSLGTFRGFHSSGITYDAVSGHPDIFLTRIKDVIVAAPNTPDEFLSFIKQGNLTIVQGENAAGLKYPSSARYNAASAGNTFIHNMKISDPVILEYSTGMKRIHVAQGYTRCSLIPLSSREFVTSDAGIHKALISVGLSSLLVDASSVILPGFNHGFIGGCCGIIDKTVYFTGKLNTLKEGSDVKDFILQAGYEIVELGSGPLFDCGSIFFI